MVPNVVTLDIQHEWFEGPQLPREQADYDFAHALAIAAEAQAQVNVVYLQRHPLTPKMYDAFRAGLIRYVAEERQPIRMLGIPNILGKHGSDCKNLIAWRLAELWIQEQRDYGKPMSHAKVYYRPGNRVFHGEIRLPATLPSGAPNPETVEDPSRFLGM